MAARRGTCYVTETLTRAPGGDHKRRAVPRRRSSGGNAIRLRLSSAFVLHIDFGTDLDTDLEQDLDKDLDRDLDKDLGNKASRLVSSFTFSPNGNK